MAAVSYQSVEETSPLATFRRALAGDNVLDRLREGLVGSTAEVVGPYGRKPLLYADYVASGRALRQVEDFILEDVLPYYANSHTEAFYCGGFMTRLRRDARSSIASFCEADKDHAVSFTGSGATARDQSPCHAFWCIRRHLSRRKS